MPWTYSTWSHITSKSRFTDSRVTVWFLLLLAGCLANCKEETRATCHCCAADFSNWISINTSSRWLWEPCGNRNNSAVLLQFSSHFSSLIGGWAANRQQITHVAHCSLSHTHKWQHCFGSVSGKTSAPPSWPARWCKWLKNPVLFGGSACWTSGWMWTAWKHPPLAENDSDCLTLEATWCYAMYRCALQNHLQVCCQEWLL